MRKWANSIFTATAIVGWITLGVLTIDCMLFDSKLTTGIMVGR